MSYRTHLRQPCKVLQWGLGEETWVEGGAGSDLEGSEFQHRQSWLCDLSSVTFLTVGSPRRGGELVAPAPECGNVQSKLKHFTNVATSVSSPKTWTLPQEQSGELRNDQERDPRPPHTPRPRPPHTPPTHALVSR